jgi:hypothetical protein
MNRQAGIVLLLLGLASPVLAGPGGLDDGERGPDPAKKCFEVRTLTPYRAYGYDHVVEIENKCDKPLQCDVKTDVNPETFKVDVPPHETRSVITFRGSPAREFKADVQCKQAQ